MANQMSQQYNMPTQFGNATDKSHEWGQPIKQSKMRTKIRPIRSQTVAKHGYKHGKQVGQLGQIKISTRDNKNQDRFQSHFEPIAVMLWEQNKVL